MVKPALLSLLLVTGFSTLDLAAQTTTAATLDAKAREEVISALSRELNRAYVFPDKATAIERDLRARQNNKVYDEITTASEFARLLTEHLQAITKDKHLRV